MIPAHSRRLQIFLAGRRRANILQKLGIGTSAALGYWWALQKMSEPPQEPQQYERLPILLRRLAEKRSDVAKGAVEVLERLGCVYAQTRLCDSGDHWSALPFSSIISATVVLPSGLAGFRHLPQVSLLRATVGFR